MFGASWLEQLGQDVRFGVRGLQNSPGFAVSAVLSLALGIGATTAIFSVIHGVIIDPFPYSHPETLYSFYATVPDRNFYFSPETPDGYLEVQARTDAFSDLIASTISDVSWTGSGEPQRLRGNYCTVNTFHVMGVQPLIGRYIVPNDGKTEAEPVAVLGYKFWRRQFNGDRGVIGRKLRLNDKVRTVVGVMPKRFMWRGADVYLPIVFKKGHAVEDVRYVFTMGRLRRGVTEAQARTELDPVLRDMLLRETGTREPKLKIVMADLYETFPSGIRKSLWTLFGAVGVLLLIACANVSNLLLARSAARSREMAVRLSLGAGRARIVRQLLTESSLIGLGAGLCGVLLAYASLQSILAIVPPDTIPDESEVTLNLPVLLFTLATSLVTAFLFGLAPAFRAGRAELTNALKGSGKGISGAFGEAKLRNAFVVAEVALAMVLLVSASLVVRTLLHVERVQVGVHPENTLTMTIPLSDTRYPTREARNRFYLDLLERAKQTPGLTDLALNQSVHPFVYFGMYATVPASVVKTKTPVVVSEISEGYPTAVNLRLLKGNAMMAADVRGAKRVALVNNKFASAFFPNGDAIGQTVQLQQSKDEGDLSCEIIGVLSDLPNVGLTRETRPEVFVPFTLTGYKKLSATLLASGGVSPASLIKPIERQIHALDPDQPVMEVRTLREWLDLRGYSEPRFSVFLFGTFAGLGLLLAAFGIYAVINYSVLRQTQEIGLRVALGAQRSRIVGTVVKSGLKLLALGVVLGTLGSLGVARLLSSVVTGISPFDPISFGAVILLLFMIGILACLRPALRASMVDPMTALRQD